MKRIVILIYLLYFTFPGFTQEAQFRGPQRNGIYPAEGLLKKWPEKGPEMILKVEDIGSGYSSPVLHNEIIYITGKKGVYDYVSAIDLEGNIIFQTEYGKAWENTYPETRSTPTVEEDRLYLVSGMGDLVCINAVNGELIWSVNVHEKYNGEIHRWGIAESPLIVEDKVLYTTGGRMASMVALNKYTGKEEWIAESLGGSRAFVSPVLYENGNIRQVVAVTANHVIGILPENGKIVWSYRYLPDNPASQRGATNNTNSPLIRGDEIFVSKGYDQYAILLKIAPDGRSVQEKWRNSVFDTHHGHYVYKGDYVFGSNWENNSKGKWVCLDWNTGAVEYEEEWNTKGSIIYADGLLYCYEERNGNIALVKPTPDKFDILSSFKIEWGTGPHWAHPYVADGKLLIRHGDVLMVFDIKA